MTGTTAIATTPPNADAASLIADASPRSASPPSRERGGGERRHGQAEPKYPRQHGGRITVA
jgi:hypothetical protein